VAAVGDSLRDALCDDPPDAVEYRWRGFGDRLLSRASLTDATEAPNRPGRAEAEAGFCASGLSSPPSNVRLSDATVEGLDGLGVWAVFFVAKGCAAAPGPEDEGVVARFFTEAPWGVALPAAVDDAADGDGADAFDAGLSADPLVAGTAEDTLFTADDEGVLGFFSGGPVAFGA
jgi:hypothetical protein